MDEKTRRYSCFQHRECEFYPCHGGIGADSFSCLFCYCPLYALGRKCGGEFTYNEKGIKDCSDCTLPHKKENFDQIIGHYREILDLIRETDRKEENK